MTFAAYLQHHAKGWTDFHWWTADRVSAFGQVIGAVGTIAAFIIALLLLGKQLQQFKQANDDRNADRARRHEEDERQQRHSAERVVAWVDNTYSYNEQMKKNTHTVYVKNSGNMPVFGCDLVFFGDLLDLNGSTGKLARFISALAPDETMKAIVETPGERLEVAAVELHFTDAAGIDWSRDRVGKLTRKPKATLESLKSMAYPNSSETTKDSDVEGSSATS